MCTGDANWKKNYDQLITDLYGGASSSIKNLFDVFYFQPQFGTAELGKSLNDINEAQNQTKDPQVLARINELSLYLTYASTYLKSQDLDNGDLEQRMLPVEKIAWTVYQKKIIHSYRIMQLVSYGFLNAKTNDKNVSQRNKKLHVLTFPESKDPDAYWKKDYSYTSNELNSMVSSRGEISRHAKSATIESAAVVNPDDVLTAASSQYKPKQNVVLKGGSVTRGYFTLYSEKPTTITINWSLVNPKGEIPSATISGTDKSYKSVYDYPLKGAGGKLSISLQAGESSFFINAASNTTYTLQLQLGDVFCYFNGSPRGKMNFLNEKGAPSYDQANYPSYFYMPKNTTEIRYKVQVNALRILTPDDKPVETTLVSSSAGGFQLRTFKVTPEQTGKFWKAIISGNYNYQFLNIPDRYFLFDKK